MRKEERGACFPLSLSQQNIWDLECAIPGTSVNYISTTIRIRGQLDIALLQESIHLVLEHDSSIHTQLCRDGKDVLQYRVPYVREDFPVYDFGNAGSEGIGNWETAVARELIPLENSPLYRFILFRDGEGSGGVLVKLHHIIADGWSQIMLCNRIGETYLHLLEGKEPGLSQAPDYELHVQEEQNYLTSKAFARDERYWKQIVSCAGEPSAFKAVTSAAVSPVGRRKSFELPQVLNHAIYTYCQEKRVAPFAVFYMALAIYFKRIGGSERFTIGVPIFNRTNYQFKQSTGMFVTTLPFYNEIKDTWSLDEFNEELMERWYEMLRHQRYPFSYISRLAEGDGRLFQVALSYQDSRIFENRNASVHFSGRWHYCGYQAEQMTIHLTNLWDHKRYAVDYDYLAQFFTEADIERLHESLCGILYEALSDPGKPIHKLQVLSIEEKEKLLYTFNETERYVEERSVYEALIRSSKSYRNRVALICDGERMSYGALFHRSGQVAAALLQEELPSNALIAIWLPRKADLLASMVGTLQAGCAYLLLAEDLPRERVCRILKQSETAVLLTDAAGKKRLGEFEIPVLLLEELEGKEDLSIAPPSKERDWDSRLAYVVYTSGSTGEPKGVEITEHNLLNLAQEMASVYGRGAVLSVCNVGFDAFMLESIVALLNGRTIVFPGKEDLDSPERLAALMNGYAVDFFSMTPSRLNAFMQNPIFCKTLWRMESIVCGGEAFPPELLKKIKRYSSARIYNQYGPSETTVAVSMKELSQADRITAGRPLGNCRLYVLDDWMNPLPVGGLGQLYVGGSCVGAGYRNRPDLTEQVFRKNPFVAEERLYFTGDIASWTPEGEIELKGRGDSQVKLRGLRIELSEVAACMEACPGVTKAYAKICELHGNQVLGAYYCAEGALSEAQVLAHTAVYLPHYMIPAFVMELEALPMSANGKVDEKRLPLPKEETGEPAVLSDTAAVVLKCFCRVLSDENLSGNSDYFLFGGNSLNAMECVMELEEALGKKVRISDLYACRTAVRLAAYLNGEALLTAKEPEKAMPFREQLEKAPKKDAYPLTPVQQGMYVQSMLDPEGLTYHMPGAFLLGEKPDKERLTKAFQTVISQEELLRTVFVQGEEGICARVLPEVSFELEELEAEDFAQASERFLRPFDFALAPLLRAALWQEKEECWYLFLDCHHIIGDGISTPLLLKRLDSAYAGKPLIVEHSYYDCVYACQQQAAQEAAEEDLAYWKQHLQNLPQPLQLPGDLPRPKNFDYQGKDFEVLLSEEESRAYEAFIKEQGISEFVLAAAAYGVLLSAISGQEDFVIGTPVAGRILPGSQEILGPFINTLPLRLRPEADLLVKDWLLRVQEEVTGLLEHQRASLEEIISALKLARGAQNSLYQVMLSQSPVEESGFYLDGQKMTYQPIPTHTVKMDLVVELAHKEGQLALRFSYASSIFLEKTVRFYSRCMRKLLRELVKNPECPLQDLRVLSPQDYQKYVEEPNFQRTPFVNLPLHKLLNRKSEAMSEKTAVIFRGQEYSYEWLEHRANEIAADLEEREISAGSCVGLLLSRTPEMIAAMYGILKAGCAYVFMLPKFPAARICYMLETAKAALLYYDEAAKGQFAADFSLADLPCQASVLPLGEREHYEDRPVTDDMLTNVHFTSGSTGKPKGVMFRHRGVSNMYAQIKALLDPIEGRVLCSTNCVFDCFLTETLVALAMGRTVVFADDEEMMLPWKLAELIENYEAGIFEMTPSRLQMCLGNEEFQKAAKKIRIALIGGEALTRTLKQKFYAYSDGILMNMYGPSESTIYTTMIPIKPEDSITIGRPMGNIRTYVLDEKRRPVLPTACGELYIAGESLAAGYISRPDLTEEAFFADLYFPEERMYKSGDCVRQRVDGTLEFIGRKDDQVKLNGQRVELDEITGSILESGLAKQASTIGIRKEDGSMELCSFYEETKEGSKEQILVYMRKVLPAYMIPSRLLAVEKLPVTASNKLDILTLKRWAVEGVSETPSEEAPAAEINLPETKSLEMAAEEPKTQQIVTETAASEVTAEYILGIWNRVLSVPAKDIHVSFFEQGGTSMAALNVLSYFYNEHLEMSLADFYENSTAAQQALLLGGRTAETSAAAPAAESVPESEPVKKDAVLVTGATGFFGAHLVKALLERETAQVICLLRDGDRNRLQEVLNWYFGEELLRKQGGKLEVVCGDLTAASLGMDLEAYQTLAKRIFAVYHAAADVRHYAAEEEAYLKTNVDGTSHMLSLAKQAEAEFYYMSTCSVGGEELKEDAPMKVFTEEDYDIGQVWEKNIYVKSKYLAEGLVNEAKKEGLSVRIFRLGRLVGRVSDGRFQKNPDNNVFYLLMKAFCELGALPASAAQLPVDLMPVDICVEEVLALRKGKKGVYHIMSGKPAVLEDCVKALKKEVQLLDDEAFTARIFAMSGELNREYLGILMNHWYGMHHGKHNVTVSNEGTLRELAELGYEPVEFSPEQVLKDFER